jgi:hypothetical protein
VGLSRFCLPSHLDYCFPGLGSAEKEFFLLAMPWSVFKTSYDNLTTV